MRTQHPQALLWVQQWLLKVNLLGALGNDGKPQSPGQVFLQPRGISRQMRSDAVDHDHLQFAGTGRGPGRLALTVHEPGKALESRPTDVAESVIRRRLFIPS